MCYNLIPGNPQTRYMDQTSTERREDNCCSMTTIPLRIFKAITTYKREGIVAGHVHFSERVVDWLTSGKQKRTPDAELVGFREHLFQKGWQLGTHYMS